MGLEVTDHLRPAEAGGAACVQARGCGVLQWTPPRSPGTDAENAHHRELERHWEYAGESRRDRKV